MFHLFGNKKKQSEISMFHTTNQATVQKPKLSRFRLLLDEGYANSSYYIFSFISQ